MLQFLAILISVISAGHGHPEEEVIDPLFCSRAIDRLKQGPENINTVFENQKRFEEITSAWQYTDNQFSGSDSLYAGTFPDDIGLHQYYQTNFESFNFFW